MQPQPLPELPHVALDAFCRRWQVRELAIFGSALRPDFAEDSDLDVLLTFEPEAAHSLFDLAAMQEELEVLTGRPVDLVDRVGLEQSHNWIRRKAILDTAQPIISHA